MVIEKIRGNIREYDLKGRNAEAIELDHYDLLKPHQKLKTGSGEIFAVSLEYGQNLQQGSIIYEDEKRVVYVDIMPEKCLVIRPEGNIQWARAAFNIGNMHQAAYVHEDCILVAYDGVLESVIKKLGVNYTCEDRKLDGLRANVSQTETHHHGHEHHHSHDHYHEKQHAKTGCTGDANE